MAFVTHVGSLTQPAATGNQSVTGAGFQPKALLFFSSENTADGTGSGGMRYGYGMAVSSTSRAAVGFISRSGLADSDSRHDNTKCVLLCDLSANALIAADLVSMDADGFTLNWTTVDATQRIINYLALGGDDLTGVAIKQFQTNTGTGPQGVTGVGFQPDAAVFLAAGGATAPPGAVATFILGSLGFATASAQAMMAVGAESGGTSDAYRAQRTDSVYGVLFNTAFIDRAALTSFDADGFTLNILATTAARYVWALCLKGGQYDVGAATQKTSTGTQATAGVGFTPTGALLMSFNAAATTSVLNDASNSIGAASSTTARATVWGGTQDATGSPGSHVNLDRTKAVQLMTPGTPTLNAEADLSSFDADGFTLDWTTADATAREVLYLAFGSAAGGGGTDGTMAAALATATAGSPNSALSGGATMSAAATTATAQGPAATLTGGATLAAAATTATAQSPAAAMSGAAVLAAEAASATAGSPAATLTGSGDATLTAAAATATAASPDAAITGGAVMAAAVTTATAASPNAAVTGEATLSAAATAATAGSPDAGMAGGGTLAGAVAQASAQSPAATLTTLVTLSAAATAATAGSPAAAMTGGALLVAAVAAATATAPNAFLSSGAGVPGTVTLLLVPTATVDLVLETTATVELEVTPTATVDLVLQPAGV